MKDNVEEREGKKEEDEIMCEKGESTIYSNVHFSLSSELNVVNFTEFKQIGT